MNYLGKGCLNQMSNETNALLQAVLEMDKQERQRTKEAEEYHGKAMAELDGKRAEIHSKHQQLAQQQIEEYAQKEADRKQQTLQTLQQKSDGVKKALHAAKAEKEQQWIDTIYNRVVER